MMRKHGKEIIVIVLNCTGKMIAHMELTRSAFLIAFSVTFVRKPFGSIYNRFSIVITNYDSVLVEPCTLFI